MNASCKRRCWGKLRSGQ